MREYQAPADLLKQRVILITGAGDGIGRAAALSFARHGATVILLGKTVRKLEQVYDEIVDAGGPQPAIYPMNLEGATATDYQELARNIEAQLGRLDGILHNAAFLGSLTPLELYDMELWTRVMQINLHAAYLLTRACLPLLKQAEDASVLFTSSEVGRQGEAYWGAYAISNAAVENMMQIFADEMETNTHIRFNSIDPGAVATAMRRRAFPGEDPNTLPAPDTIMPVYLYLMGPDSQDTNGQSISAQSPSPARDCR
ncbi:MAG: YciK family oxidoreductase [Gammaproteobacteria bacterium]|nr:YciK family oxidoreductase [Gammaproteobacteria bacterium]